MKKVEASSADLLNASVGLVVLRVVIEGLLLPAGGVVAPTRRLSTQP